MQTWELKTQSRNGNMLRGQTMLAQMHNYENKTVACRALPVANVCGFLLSGNLHSALQEAINKQHYRNIIHGNVPNCHKWTEEHITVQKLPFGTFTSASHFLTLVLVWLTFWIVECAKQGCKSTRRETEKLAVEKVPSVAQVP